MSGGANAYPTYKIINIVGWISESAIHRKTSTIDKTKAGQLTGPLFYCCSQTLVPNHQPNEANNH